jgi:hypothetical protein
MNLQETLDAIAALVADDERGAAAFGTDVDPLTANIRTLLDQRAASQEEMKPRRAEWAAEIRSAATLAKTIDGADFGRRLELALATAASFVEHGSDLGGGMLPLRIKHLAEATIVHAHTDAARVRAAADAADALRAAGTELFNTVGATGSRPAWKAEEALRAAFSIPDPDAAPATSAPEKKE